MTLTHRPYAVLPGLAALTVCLAGCLTGCMVGPDYAVPQADYHAEWIESANEGLSADADVAADWWRTFNDPVLDKLVTMAYEQNLSLKIAGLRVLEARASRGIAAGEFFPQLQQARGGYGRINTSEDVANPAPRQSFDSFDVGLDVVWEVDVWGRFRRGIESADASLYASVMNYDDVLVSLVAEVALAYIDIRSLDQRLAYARQNVKTQKNTVDVTDVLFRNGEGNELDVQQARSNLANTESLVPKLQGARRGAVYRLCFLLGRTPGDLDELLGNQVGIPTPPADVAIGVPAELMRRRPDVRRAEREAAAQSARIGVAESALYPHFTLNGSIGYAAENASDLFSGGAVAGSFGPAFRWDILNYGRIINAVRVQDARFEQLVVSYQNTVLRAASEVEIAATAYVMSQREQKSLAESVAASSRAVELALTQFRGGEVDFTRVLDTQEFLTVQQDRLATSQRDVAGNLITLYRALGGGWQLRDGQTFVDPDTQQRMRDRTNWGSVIDPDHPARQLIQPKPPVPSAKQ